MNNICLLLLITLLVVWLIYNFKYSGFTNQSIMKYIHNNGYHMIENRGFDFANMFDWIMTQDKIIKNNDNPKHIYIKHDYVPKYIDTLLSIDDPYILITGCSDSSLFVNYNSYYKKLIDNPNIKAIYTLNNLHYHPKVFSITNGLASYDTSYEDELVNLNKNINDKSTNKIFCCWRNNTSNICGNEFLERPSATKIVLENPSLYDYYEDLTEDEFLNKLATYKWCLCPLGNGVDLAPKILICFFLKVVPIAKKNMNVISLYEKYPVIWVDDFSEINEDILTYDYNTNYNKILEEFTCEYWFNKIVSVPIQNIRK